MHGFGVYQFANGHHYEGAWHEGRRQGLGMYTFRNGEMQSGHWQNGVLDIPSTQNTTYPVSPVAVYHSKVLNVVQVLVLNCFCYFVESHFFPFYELGILIRKIAAKEAYIKLQSLFCELDMENSN